MHHIELRKEVVHLFHHLTSKSKIMFSMHPQKKNDIFIATRSLAKSLKYSLHPSLEWPPSTCSLTQMPIFFTILHLEVALRLTLPSRLVLWRGLHYLIVTFHSLSFSILYQALSSLSFSDRSILCQAL